MPADFDMECRRPGCKERISTNVPFGACRLHHDQLSTWDFKYCEAEKRDRDKEADHFLNGQCIKKKEASSFHCCRRHTDERYKWRKAFADSDCIKDGKWFEGRNEGTADFPPGYGTSGAKSFRDQFST